MERWEKQEECIDLMKITFLGTGEIPRNLKIEIINKVIRPTIVYSSESTVSVKYKPRMIALGVRFL